jgi:hypothetical protein
MRPRRSRLVCLSSPLAVATPSLQLASKSAADVGTAIACSSCNHGLACQISRPMAAHAVSNRPNSSLRAGHVAIFVAFPHHTDMGRSAVLVTTNSSILHGATLAGTTRFKASGQHGGEQEWIRQAAAAQRVMAHGLRPQRSTEASSRIPVDRFTAHPAARDSAIPHQHLGSPCLSAMGVGRAQP